MAQTTQSTQKLDQAAEMGVDHSHVAVQLPVLGELRHHGPRAVDHLARATLSVQRSHRAISICILAGYRHSASDYSSAI